MKKKVAIYCQPFDAGNETVEEKDLLDYAARSGYEVIGVWKEACAERGKQCAVREKLMALAREKRIDAVLVTDVSHWGRNSIDLLNNLDQLQTHDVSLIAQNGFSSSPSLQ